MAKVYRIVKQTNGRGKVRWQVQEYWAMWRSTPQWWNEWPQHRTLKAAQRHLERLREQGISDTWTEEVVG